MKRLQSWAIGSRTSRAQLTRKFGPRRSCAAILPGRTGCWSGLVQRRAELESLTRKDGPARERKVTIPWGGGGAGGEGAAEVPNEDDGADHGDIPAEVSSPWARRTVLDTREPTRDGGLTTCRGRCTRTASEQRPRWCSEEKKSLF
jgi:hypothetical protein